MDVLKKLLFIVSLIMIYSVQSASAYQVYLFGKSSEDFFAQNPFYVAAGFVAALAVHEASHLIAYELTDLTYEYNEGLAFHAIYSGQSDSDMQWVARSGFVGQMLVGTALKVLPKTKDSAFTSGFHQWSALETLTYPLRRPSRGDLQTLKNHGGNEKAEWLFYSAWSMGNLIKITW